MDVGNGLVGDAGRWRFGDWILDIGYWILDALDAVLCQFACAMQGLLKGCRPSGPRWTLSLDRPACRSGLDADVAATDTMQSRAESPRVSEIHVRCWWFLSESILYCTV